MILLYKNNHSIETLNNNLSITDNFVNELEPYATKLTSINSSLKKCIKGTTIAEVPLYIYTMAAFKDKNIEEFIKI